MGTDETGSTTPPDYYPLPETPVGLVVVALLGIVSGLAGFFTWMATFGVETISTSVTVGMMLLAAAQVIAMLGLVRLSEWAWYATLGIYAVTGLIHVSRANAVGALVSLVVILYVGYQSELFTS